MAAVIIRCDLGAQENKVWCCFHCFPIYLPWSDGTRCHDLSFLNVELDYKESWMPKNWCFWTMVLEKTLERPLDCKEIQPVHPKGNQSWIFIGRTDVQAETPILWPPDVKNWLIWKDPDAGKGWRQEEKGTTEDEMVGWHHQLLEFTRTHVHWIKDAIQPCHLLSSPSPPAFNLSQHQGLFK